MNERIAKTLKPILEKEMLGESASNFANAACR
jgi:hypothetical protein